MMNAKQPDTKQIAATAPPAPGSVARIFRRCLALLCICFFAACAYFYGGGMWNQNARYDAIFSFVQPGPERFTFRIDSFLKDPAAGCNTGDWACYDGHYYANKAPGTLLLGTAVYAGIYLAEHLTGLDPARQDVQIFSLYLIDLLVSALPLAIALYCFGLLMRRTGAGIEQALLLTAALGFGTLLFPYSTQFWGHPTAAAFVIMGIWALARRSRSRLALGGFFLGLATLCDYLAALAAIGGGLYVLCRVRRRLGWYIAGGLPVLAVFMLYHALCFGSPFAVANQFENPIFREGGYFFGGRHFFAHLVGLLATRYRGVPVQMPILLLTPVGIGFWLRRQPRDLRLWVCLGMIAAFLGANALFNGWHGGATVGPRYQIPALVFWVLCLRAVPWRGIWKTVFRALLAVSMLNMLAIAAVSPISPPAEAGSPAIFFNPLYGWTYGLFFAGKLAPWKPPLLLHGGSPWNAWNLGQLAGLPGLLSLAPLVLVEALGFVLIYRWIRRASSKNAL